MTQQHGLVTAVHLPKRISMSATGDAVMSPLAQWMSIVASVGKSHSDLVCYVHIHSLPHFHVCEPFPATCAWQRVTKALRRAVYRINYLAQRGIVAHVCFLGYGLICVRTKGHVAWTCPVNFEQEGKPFRDGSVGDRSFFGLEGEALCEASGQQQNPR